MLSNRGIVKADGNGREEHPPHFCRDPDSTFLEIGWAMQNMEKSLVSVDLECKIPKESLENLRGMTPLGRLGQPEDVAAAALFWASDSTAYITGETIAVNGGLRMDLAS